MGEGHRTLLVAHKHRTLALRRGLVRIQEVRILLEVRIPLEVRNLLEVRILPEDMRVLPVRKQAVRKDLQQGPQRQQQHQRPQQHNLQDHKMP